MEAVECGAAALSIILAYHGRIVPLAKLRQECGVSRDGSKASKIVGAARNYGMEANGFKAETLDQLDEISPPYIVFWEFNHFLVVEGFNKHQVFLNDPATGPRKVSWDEFDEGFTGVILTIEPGDEFEKSGRKPSIIPLLYQRLRPSLGAIIYCIIAGFLLVIPGLTVPVFSQIFVDNILVENRTNWLRPLVLGMTIAMILQTLLTLLRLRYLRKLMIKLSVGMSSQFMWHILRLPVGFYAQRYAGEISDRVNINNEVAQVLSGQLATTVIDTVMIVFYGLVMFAYDHVLTLIGISFAAVNILALQWVSRQRVDANMRLVQDEGKLAGASIAGLQSMETLKASALESDFFSRWSGYYAKTVNTQQQLEVTNQALEILPTFLSSLTSVLVLVVGGLRVMEGELSIGMLVAFQSLMLNFQEPVNTLVGFSSTLQELEGDLNRLDDVLSNETQEEAEGEKEQVFEESKLKGYVELRNITFGYSQVDPPLVIDFNLSLQPGQKIALVGGSGSGKSTIAKLICGLYQPWEGEILFDGVPRENISPTVLTHSLSMVEQEIFLFGGTVRDNLTLWNPTISTTQLMKACQDAVIHEAVMAFPGGYDGELLEGGANLSGGQRQRLEIARALVNNPTILVMDEATSALDAETEKMIVDNLQSRGCSCIIVAHRLSTIRDCDEIIVLEYGEVVQRGTHEEMLQEEGVYRELISSEG
ncbi:MAG: NHLP family bacteriocin export ABC transporter peptidase/permease/ATPase subunit [Okeania sp. SIO2G4]|uniref:NHLP family bacteriocin export ABC transporter peptidase/permease/ATPase subunit n=1 Tax=unclassified Okeania TaxID=2634635 RepID=UPI0013B5C10B|nr:NHLP family bacteriocin export ABC transporter peptidase/permease/ATPase subunit [Okeania sp. SIO2H7]NEP73521.1 NHLP family bacteriocin export ABC transporter peptidase/permease/ATPase subunit [Okeania sp. SIO2G5]NEP95887.1 NHLP family bacteriocin export ABC transporter peptidase/permease/ATPase subunit [Okeania sp. SIO2F5]NEQ92944.1 NHLP family bacteriocin export ABC transporter peptidase/permease/ATPase subunit [Okeania sp. SIO2G4]